MDPFARAYYELRLENAFLKKRGEAYQDLFSTIMEKRYPRDFQRTRPWGSAGDRKNDGYLRSQRTLFQVYAPNELESAKAVAKIDEDFTGALPHWRAYFDKWVFVHNAWDGLGPDVLQKLLDLAAVHTQIRLEQWGPQDLWNLVFELEEAELAVLFGTAPTRSGMISLRMAELIPILDQIGRLHPTAAPDLRPVPADKLKENLLSDHVATLLRAGMVREQLVRDYFRSRTDPRQRDQISEAFRRQYTTLRSDGLAPDDIFVGLQQWVGGENLGPAHHQEAVLAVLAYMFQECEIFERSASGGAA
ncbi:MAG: hypothetical protein IPN01_15195 [Deltaproteobacteria bacterium]|nr:hypothetical protein [Deltaproteobacteria bacterium]